MFRRDVSIVQGTNRANLSASGYYLQPTAFHKMVCYPGQSCNGVHGENLIVGTQTYPFAAVKHFCGKDILLSFD